MSLVDSHYNDERSCKNTCHQNYTCKYKRYHVLSVRDTHPIEFRDTWEQNVLVGLNVQSNIHSESHEGIDKIPKFPASSITSAFIVSLLAFWNEQGK